MKWVDGDAFPELRKRVFSTWENPNILAGYLDIIICLAFGLFMTLVFGSRFLLEFLKTPQAAYEAGFAISVGQWLSVPFILLGIIMMVKAKPVRV